MITQGPDESLATNPTRQQQQLQQLHPQCTAGCMQYTADRRTGLRFLAPSLSYYAELPIRRRIAKPQGDSNLRRSWLGATRSRPQEMRERAVRHPMMPHARATCLWSAVVSLVLILVLFYFFDVFFPPCSSWFLFYFDSTSYSVRVYDRMLHQYSCTAVWYCYYS